MGVVKNIIPAVASTNALISAACVLECLKLLTGFNTRMDNYMQYLGQTRVSVSTLPYEKKESCLVCGRVAQTLDVNVNEKISGIKTRLIE
jgi:NEDD8-activating enzyme E1